MEPTSEKTRRRRERRPVTEAGQTVELMLRNLSHEEARSILRDVAGEYGIFIENLTLVINNESTATVLTGEIEMRDQYNVNNEDLVGSQAIGSNAQATTGNVTQIVPRESAIDIISAITELASILKSVQVPEKAPLEAAQNALEDMKSEAESKEPQRSLIAKSWDRAKSWIQGALGVGVFATSTAEKVKELIGKITGLLS